MSSIQDIIASALIEAQTTIKTMMVARKINASGRTSNAIKVAVGQSGAKLYKEEGEVAPMATLEVGREGGNVPVGFYEIIKQWTRDKGLQFETEAERGTFAYFVARKIAREGTKRHTAHEEIYSSAVTEAAITINDALRKFVIGRLAGSVSTGVPLH